MSAAWKRDGGTRGSLNAMRMTLTHGRNGIIAVDMRYTGGGRGSPARILVSVSVIHGCYTGNGMNMNRASIEGSYIKFVRVLTIIVSRIQYKPSNGNFHMGLLLL